MNITYYTIKDGKEIEVKSWREASHCIIDCDMDGDLFEAGMWVEKHKRTIADYNVFDTCTETPYIEVYKAKKN